MIRVEILGFCNRWLPAWEGNKPDDLIQFYSTHALYIDPANKKGLKGRDELLRYFKKLLAANPDWRWEPIEVFPTELGFILKWKATIPTGEELITEYGMDIVDMDKGRITRNEVYFDRSRLLERTRTLEFANH
jgi:hypothetical protein